MKQNERKKMYRIFPRLFTHGGDLSPPHMGGGVTSAEGQSVNGGLLRGGGT